MDLNALPPWLRDPAVQISLGIGASLLALGLAAGSAGGSSEGVPPVTSPPSTTAVEPTTTVPTTTVTEPTTTVPTTTAPTPTEDPLPDTDITWGAQGRTCVNGTMIFGIVGTPPFDGEMRIYRVDGKNTLISSKAVTKGVDTILSASLKNATQAEYTFRFSLYESASGKEYWSTSQVYEGCAP